MNQFLLLLLAEKERGDLLTKLLTMNSWKTSGFAIRTNMAREQKQKASAVILIPMATKQQLVYLQMGSNFMFTETIMETEIFTAAHSMEISGMHLTKLMQAILTAKVGNQVLA